MNASRRIVSVPAITVALATAAPAIAQQPELPAYAAGAHVIGLDGSCGSPAPELATWIAEHDQPQALQARSVVHASVGRLGSPTRSAGLDIQFALSAAAAADSDLVAGIEEAAQIFEDRYSDDIVILFAIDKVTDVGFLAATTRSASVRPYGSVRLALIASADAEETGLTNAITFLAPQFDGDSGVFFTDNVSVTFAQSIALGFGDPNGVGADSSISFNGDINWDYDRSNGISFNAFDFVGTATHEFGHALGFISSVDTSDPTPTIWDLFRSGSEGFPGDVDNLSEFTSTPRVVATGARAAFDTAGGIQGFEGIGTQDPESFDLSTGVNGDGRQASHWRDNNITGVTVGIMDPTGSPGELDIFTDADTAAFSIMGYSTTQPPMGCNDADIAEPFGTLDLSDVQTFLIGFGAMDPVADIAGGSPGPDGLFDLQDVQTFLIAFGAGCP